MLSTITYSVRVSVGSAQARLRQRLLPNDDRLYWIEEIGLFLGVWLGKKAEMTANWLRWWDSHGNLLLWGSERVEQERQRAEQERQRAEQERQRAEQERQRAEQAEIALEQERSSSQRLAQKLRELGVDPNKIDT